MSTVSAKSPGAALKMLAVMLLVHFSGIIAHRANHTITLKCSGNHYLVDGSRTPAKKAQTLMETHTGRQLSGQPGTVATGAENRLRNPEAGLTTLLKLNSYCMD